MARKSSPKVSPKPGRAPDALWLFRAHKRLEIELGRDVSQEEAAAMLDIHVQTYGDYWRGQNPIPRAVLGAMHTALQARGITDVPFPPGFSGHSSL